MENDGNDKKHTVKSYMIDIIPEYLGHVFDILLDDGPKADELLEPYARSTLFTGVYSSMITRYLLAGSPQFDLQNCHEHFGLVQS
ncbi:hypothetical protein FRC02_009704 [Tulasnella sp. 418]|nr:hypothetical protein FRC02_009704 [Tulasnella sp. 418]